MCIRDSHKVVVEITSYGKKGKKPEGKVVEIIGHIDDPGTDILSIVKAVSYTHLDVYKRQALCQQRDAVYFFAGYEIYHLEKALDCSCRD